MYNIKNPQPSNPDIPAPTLTPLTWGIKQGVLTYGELNIWGVEQGVRGKWVSNCRVKVRGGGVWGLVNGGGGM